MSFFSAPASVASNQPPVPRSPWDARTVGLAACGIFLFLSLLGGFVEKSSGYDSLRQFLLMRFIAFGVVMTWIVAVSLILNTPLSRYRVLRLVVGAVFLAAILLGGLALVHLVLMTASIRGY